MPAATRITLVSAAVLTACAAWPAAADGRGTWRWPVAGELLTPFSNGSDPYARGRHRGIDIAAPEGTPVVAAAGGTVRHAGSVGRSGIVVSIRTSGGRYDTSYLHLARAEVARGERVPAGARLGTVGRTGRRSVGRPHLHFGVRRAGERHAYLAPLTLLGPPPGPAPESRPPLVPVERRRQASRARPAPVRETSPRRSPAPTARSRPVPAGSRDRRPARTPLPVPVPLVGPGSAHAAATPRAGSPAYPAAPPAASAAPHPGSPSAAPRSRGISLGWLAACAGLLALAAMLASPARRAVARRPQRASAQRA